MIPHNIPRDKIIEEFVGLRSKMYSVKAPTVNDPDNFDQEGCKKKAKGIKKCVVKNELSFDNYKDCLFKQEKYYRKMNLIRSYKHEVYTVEVNKLALSWIDDKRVVLKYGIDTLPWGHDRIKEK
jgi:hypothetical protein